MYLRILITLTFQFITTFGGHESINESVSMRRDHSLVKGECEYWDENVSYISITYPKFFYVSREPILYLSDCLISIVFCSHIKIGDIKGGIYVLLLCPG